MVLETVRKFVKDVAEPKALDCDEHGEFVRAQIDQLAELGMLGLPVGEASGGAGMGWVATVVALEEIATACSSTAQVLAGHAAIAAPALEGLGSAKALLGELCMGEKLATWIGPEARIALEPHGPDAGGTLTGVAPLVTGGGEAQVFVVACRQGDQPALAVVEASAAKITAARPLGFRATAPAQVEFARAAATVVAVGPDAQAAWMRAEIGACASAAAIASGLLASSLRLSVAYARERIAFGKPLTAQQAVAHKLARMQRRLAAARHGAYHVARLLDAGDGTREAAWVAKLEAVDAAVEGADEAIQIHGGYGFVVEYHVERHYRDAKTLEVLEGGHERLRDDLAALAVGGA